MRKKFNYEVVNKKSLEVMRYSAFSFTEMKEQMKKGVIGVSATTFDLYRSDIALLITYYGVPKFELDSCAYERGLCKYLQLSEQTTEDVVQAWNFDVTRCHPENIRNLCELVELYKYVTKITNLFAQLRKLLADKICDDLYEATGAMLQWEAADNDRLKFYIL